jgi:hypothetical protein
MRRAHGGEICAATPAAPPAAAAAAGAGGCVGIDGALCAPAAGLFACGHAPPAPPRCVCVWHPSDRPDAAFRLADTDQMLALPVRPSTDFAGGTRSATRWPACAAPCAAPGGQRRTLVLLITDGLDTGEPEVLERELGWLRRHSAGWCGSIPCCASRAMHPWRGVRPCCTHGPMACWRCTTWKNSKTWRPAWRGRWHADTRRLGLPSPFFEQEHRFMDMQASRAARRDPATGLGCAERPRGAQAVHPGLRQGRGTGRELRHGVAVKIGPVSAKFGGQDPLGDIVPPSSYTITFDGQGGAAGFGKGSARWYWCPTMHRLRARATRCMPRWVARWRSSASG